MLDLETQDRNSKTLAGIYAEVRFNFEEFLGFPMAGVQAMSLPNFGTKSAAASSVNRRTLFVEDSPPGFVVTVGTYDRRLRLRRFFLLWVATVLAATSSYRGSEPPGSSPEPGGCAAL